MRDGGSPRAKGSGPGAGSAAGSESRDGGSPRAKGSGPGAGSAAGSDSPVRAAGGQSHKHQGSGRPSTSPVQVARGQFHKRCHVFKGIPSLCKRYNACRTWYRCENGPRRAAPGHETRQWGRLTHIGAGKQPAPTHRYLPQCTATRSEAAPGHETRQWGRLAHIGAGKQPAPTHRYLPQCTATRPEAAPETGHGPAQTPPRPLPHHSAGNRTRPVRSRRARHDWEAASTSSPSPCAKRTGRTRAGRGRECPDRQEDASGARAQEPGHAKKTRAGRGHECPRPPALPTVRGLSPPEGP